MTRPGASISTKSNILKVYYRQYGDIKSAGTRYCDKWLKDRKNRVLSLDEMQTYCRIVTAIHKTIVIQKAIDEVYKEVEKTTITPEMRE